MTRMNLYDIEYKVIMDRTSAMQCSYVEFVVIADQFPEWFVSHWWGGACVRFHQMSDQTCKRSRIELGYSILNLCK